MPNTYNLVAPDAGASKEVKTRVKRARFGDGYEQVLPDGLNSVMETWSLNWTNRTRAQIDAIDSFLTTEKGATYFLWTTPQGVQKKFRCERWTPVYNNDYDCSLSASFEQVFAL